MIKNINFFILPFTRFNFNRIIQGNTFNFTSSSKLEVQVRQKIKQQNKKISKQLTVLKKQLSKKQPLRSKSLYDKYHHKEIYLKIDTEMQAFFYKRSYDLENFNFLINLLIQQKKFEYIDKVLDKMKMINILPDQRTYNYLIKAASVQGDIKKAQKMFVQASKRFLPNKYFYNSLIQCYVNNRNSQMAAAILRQMLQKDIIPDLPIYTSVINCFRKDRNLPKCWQLHRDIVKRGVELDQTYIGVMMKVYAGTHDSQKCIKLYRQHIMEKGIQPMIQTKNAYMKALSTRQQYSNDVIDMFFDIYQKGQIITVDTVRWALKATATGANLKSAIQILKIMKISGIQPTKQIYNSLLRVYAKVCDIPQMKEQLRQIILVDTFKLLQQIQSKDMVDTTILNNVLYVYSMSDQSQKIDGLILPMYQKFGLQYNPYTFEILMEMYFKKNDFNTALRIWNQAKNNLQQKKQKTFKELQNAKFIKNHLANKQQLRETFNMIHTYLDIGIKMMDMRMILDALQMFKKLGRPPKNETLKFLGNLKNLPQEILTSLMDFKIRFGAVKLSKKNQGHVDDPQNK